MRANETVAKTLRANTTASAARLEDLDAAK
jgi:hypothetical protein